MLILITTSCADEHRDVHLMTGKWAGIENPNMFIVIDSKNKYMSVDYRRDGGRLFSGQYTVDSLNNIHSLVLPGPTKFELTYDGYLTLTPSDSSYGEFIPSIYTVKFKKYK